MEKIDSFSKAKITSFLKTFEFKLLLKAIPSFLDKNMVEVIKKRRRKLMRQTKPFLRKMEKRVRRYTNDVHWLYQISSIVNSGDDNISLTFEMIRRLGKIGSTVLTKLGDLCHKNEEYKCQYDEKEACSLCLSCGENEELTIWNVCMMLLRHLSFDPRTKCMGKICSVIEEMLLHDKQFRLFYNIFGMLHINRLVSLKLYLEAKHEICDFVEMLYFLSQFENKIFSI